MGAGPLGAAGGGAVVGGGAVDVVLGGVDARAAARPSASTSATAS
ncbi:MAG: hypothetical protein R2711_04240 [Acidimicrobiales bacterium]